MYSENSIIIWILTIGSSNLIVADTTPPYKIVFKHDLFDFCNITCGNRKHTICPDVFKDSTIDNTIIDLSTSKNKKIKNYLIIGHNGIRDRISKNMKMKEMLELNWDEDLEEMAEIYFKHNSPFSDDECTNDNTGYSAEKQFQFFEKGTNAHTFISQNRFCIESKFFPSNLVELAVRSFYYDKNQLDPPQQKDFDDMIKVTSYELVGINNFTHLAFGLAHRFGCAIVATETHHCVVCNYYPFFIRNNSIVYYKEEAHDCPPQFPFVEKMFLHLCTFDSAPAQIGKYNFLLIFIIAEVSKICNKLYKF